MLDSCQSARTLLANSCYDEITMTVLAMILMMWIQMNTATAQEAELAAFQKACTSQAHKKAAVCRCITANLRIKSSTQEYGVEKLADAVKVIKNEVPADEVKPSYFDSLADFIAGLEERCQSKPNYQFDKP